MPRRQLLVSMTSAALVTAFTFLPGALAQSSCPASAEPGRSVVLTSAAGRKSEITWLDANRVRIIEESPGSRTFPRETISFRGLIGVELSRPTGTVRLQFSAPLEGLFPLVVGRQQQLDYSAGADGQPPIKARMTIAAIEPLKHGIGRCTFDALLIGSLIEFESGGQAPVRYDVYIPALQVVAKSTTFDAVTNSVLESESFEYDAISSK
jgi:hypothetical protein